MIKFLLQEIEKSLNPVFTKKELISISIGDFQNLKERKILEFRRPSEQDLEGIRLPRCQHGCTLTVSPIGEGLEAICLTHPEEDPIQIQPDELARYIFSIDAFLLQIRKSNKIEGKIHRIKGGYFYVGYRLYDNKQVGFIFIPQIGEGKHVILSGLKHISEKDDFVIVLTPDSKIEDVILKRALRRDRILQLSLISILNLKTFELRIDDVISKLIKPKAELTRVQRRDYDKFDYLCKDQIHFSGVVPGYHSNLVSVNGSDVRIGDSLFLLLLRLAAELKKKNGGWTNTYTLYTESVISDPERYQKYSYIRSEIEGYLQDRDGGKFIQSDRSKNYRISTHPDFVTFDRKKLREHPDTRIREIVDKMPKSRH